MKKILISGGWGYRNLGDDAILIATIKLLTHQHPNIQIIVASYEPKETLKIVSQFPNVSVVPSIQLKLFGNSLYYDYCPPEKWSLTFKLKYHLRSWFIRLRNKIHYISLEIFPKLYYKMMKLCYPPFTKLFNNIDMLFMSGGGYINESIEVNITHFLEIEFAYHYKIPTYIIGQTIGPFKRKRTKKLIKRYLSKVEKILVRDRESQKELQDLNIKVGQHIIPDLALSDFVYLPNKNQSRTLTIIPFFGINNYFEEIVQLIKDINSIYHYEIIITVSQQWTQPIVFGKALNKILTEQNILSKFIYPHNVFELQEILTNSKIVLSQNLHGLIMSYRAGTKIVSLNNKRKFISFIDQINLNGKCFSLDDIKSKDLKEYIIQNIENQIIYKPNQDLATEILTELQS